MRREYRLVDSLPNSGVLLKNRFWAISETADRSAEEAESKICEIRSYMDYCPAGTVHDLLQRYEREEREPNNHE